MKKIILFSTIIAIVAMMTSCGAKNPEKTIVNLKTAFNGESSASAKYAAFAQNAMEHGYDTIAKFFAAASASEAIHANNHKAVLAQLGVKEIQPIIEDFTIGTIEDNLKAAKAGEVYEVETMYPEFLKVANEEGCNEAVTSYTYAMDSEKKHIMYYALAIDNIANESVLIGEFYVCPVCGNTFYGQIPSSCELCMAPKDNFKKI